MNSLPGTTFAVPPKPNYKKMYRAMHTQIAARIKWIEANPFVPRERVETSSAKVQTKLANASTCRTIKMPDIDTVWCHVILHIMRIHFRRLQGAEGLLYMQFASRKRALAVQAFTIQHATDMNLTWLFKYDYPEFGTITVITKCCACPSKTTRQPVNSLSFILYIHGFIDEYHMCCIARNAPSKSDSVYLSTNVSGLPDWCRVFRDGEEEVSKQPAKPLAICPGCSLF
jgi:hypothetical protein